MGSKSQGSEVAGSGALDTINGILGMIGTQFPESDMHFEAFD